MPTETAEAMTKVREAIREAIDGGAVDPRDIAEKADANLTDEMRAAVWPHFLATFAREVIRMGRMQSTPDDRPPASVPLAPVPAPRKGDAPVEAGGKKYASPTQAHMSSWWDDQCGYSRFVNGKWKAFADFSVKEVRALAANRKKSAAELLAVGARYARFADEMEKRGVARVGDLDEATARSLWGPAALVDMETQ